MAQACLRDAYTHRHQPLKKSEKRVTLEPKISIVTAARNAEQFIAETIQSVQAQGLLDWEHIIVDDGSTDRTVEVAREAGDHRLRIISQPSVGQSAAQNAGLAEARAKYVVMLDADDRLLADTFHRLKAPLEAQSDLTMAFGHVWLIDQDGASLGARQQFQASPSQDRLRDLLQRNLITTGGAAMIRSDALRQIGGFDPTLNMAQGWECWVRLAAHGPIAEVGGEAVLEYRLRSGSVARLGLTDPARSKPAVDLMFNNPKIIARFSQQILADLRRRCDAHLSYMAGHEALRVGDQSAARRHLLRSLRANAVRHRTWILFACAIARWIPRPVAARLGVTTK